MEVSRFQQDVRLSRCIWWVSRGLTNSWTNWITDTYVWKISRHGERYPNEKHGRGRLDHKAVVQRMKDSGIRFSGYFEFFNDWELFWSGSLEQLTSTGPFAGTLGAFTTGVRLRTRYKRLLSKASESPNHPVKFWASDSRRVIATARHFALAFFGIDFEANKVAALEIIPEHSQQGANTLTPGRTCLANKHHHEAGRKQGYKLVREYQAIFIKPIRKRLRQQTSMTFTDIEIWSMMEMCGFETTVRGRSDWCDVFTQAEFLSFEYARDVLHYYRAGPGNKYASSMGSLFLNATTNLMLEGPSAGPLFFSFVHDGDLTPMLAALDIINDNEHLPATHMVPNRKWRTSQILPMGGRIIFELLSCNVTRPSGRRKFVRLNINDGITAIPDCDNGPGMSCPLEKFAARTKSKTDEAGDFRKACGLGDDAADRITFLHQRWES
ncbi:phosphoglycerate mutase-like protein [Dothidotthia symphoricarpi CBS 119687]|uniref:Phosphoglycerate mutase-like protein n=1 Tax=Dothidotthia symphoricarpi CBS 119687 TaxID=1392245 RepID=A0A6A6AIM4_9PLEO|nr:phosphoglycerate mutase-like protein [Dothidotthia symphoricarpi CBS 119687]KAF2131083.1 phosphoglycerate mutase-like protein [Dothidotthia symphoricarpi CBS 119687]